MLAVNHGLFRSPPFKRRKFTRPELLPVDVPPVGSPVKPIANVVFKVDESFEDLVGASRLTKVMRSEFGLNNETVMFVGGVHRYGVVRYRRYGWSV